jgi:hypothetical protein
VFAGKIMAERVTKYYEDHLRAKDAVVDKLRLKNQSLRATFVKAEAALKTKEEVGDVLHYIDFHQLQARVSASCGEWVNSPCHC